MSKFFNETLRARIAEPHPDQSKLGTVHGIQEVAGVQDAPSNLGTSQLEQPETATIPLADLLHTRFKGSDSLESAEESYRALRTRLLRLRSAQELRSIVVTSAIQGEGKTMTSLNLALCCARLHDMKILLIDGDIRTRGLSHNLRLPPGPGLSEVLEGQCEPQEAILGTDLPNLRVLGCGSPTMPPAELFASPRWRELTGWCAESFQLILVDSPPILNLADVELITAACDGLLMVVRALKTRRDVLQKSASQIDSKKFLGVVYNAAENGSPYRYERSTYGARFS